MVLSVKLDNLKLKTRPKQLLGFLPQILRSPPKVEVLMASVRYVIELRFSWCQLHQTFSTPYPPEPPQLPSFRLTIFVTEANPIIKFWR
jgi:hypothetical protein